MIKMDIKNFKDWEIDESISSDEQLNEIFGLGAFFKSLFKRLSEPVRKKVEIITKNIDSKTGKIKDSKALVNDILQTFKSIADDKKADIKGVDNKDDFKKYLKEFFIEIKAVFSAARIPFNSLAESLEFDENFESLSEHIHINEKLSREQRKKMNKTNNSNNSSTEENSKEEPKPTGKVLNLSDIMLTTNPDEFDSSIDDFIENWIEKKSPDKAGMIKFDKKLESEGIKLIDTILKKFEQKIKLFGPERLEKLIKLTTENPTPKKEDIKKILDEKPEEAQTGETVETDSGKQQFLKAVEKAIKDGSEMEKIKNGDNWDVLIKDVKL